MAKEPRNGQKRTEKARKGQKGQIRPEKPRNGQKSQEMAQKGQKSLQGKVRKRSLDFFKCFWQKHRNLCKMSHF